MKEIRLTGYTGAKFPMYVRFFKDQLSLRDRKHLFIPVIYDKQYDKSYHCATEVEIIIREKISICKDCFNNNHKTYCRVGINMKMKRYRCSFKKVRVE